MKPINILTHLAQANNHHDVLKHTIQKPIVLCIAGFDPSAGAGILSDIKTIEANDAYGLGVCTGITFQNDIVFKGVRWETKSSVLKQIQPLLSRFTFNVAKIGLVKDFQVLSEIVNYLKTLNPTIKIIWDPIVKATAGFEFHQKAPLKATEEICKKIFLITPNLSEITTLVPHASPKDGAEYLSKFCNVLLKGGHASSGKATDILFTEGQKYFFSSNKIENGDKHGSGCVLSSAIAAELAKALDLITSCQRAKNYITRFLKSNDSLLGYHIYAS